MRKIFIICETDNKMLSTLLESHFNIERNIFKNKNFYIFLS